LKKYFYILLSLIIIISGCESKKAEWNFGTKTYLNQNNKPFKIQRELEGNIWIANFIFTNCETVCLPMSANFKKLAELVEKENLKVKFISFSVDPEIDNPETLKRYSSNYDAEKFDWNFLTSYSQKYIEKYAKDKFQTYVYKPDSSNTDHISSHNQVIHGTSFYLVDKNGHIVETYAGVQDVKFDEIINKIKEID
jgi:protein SCO1/2